MFVGSFVEAIVDRNGALLAIDAVLIAVTTAGSTAFITIAGVVGYGTLTGRVDLFLTAKVAQVVNAAPGLSHLEQPDHARELELLSEQRQLLAGGPNLAMALTADVVRTIATLLVLATVAPILIVVPLLTFVPFGCDVLSTRYRARVDNSLALDIRLANRLLALTTSPAAASELRVFDANPALADRHATLARHIVHRTEIAGVVSGLLGTAGWIVFAAAYAGAIFFVADRAVHGQVTLGQVALTILILQRVQTSISQLALSVAQMLTATRVARRFMWLEDQIPPSLPGSHMPPERLGHGITLDHVSFRYPHSDALVLDNISLHLPAGTSIAIVGENGAGKTTLSKLLTRMYEPATGTINIDRTPLAAMDVAAWRARTTATFQDFARFELRAGHVVGLGDLPRIDDDNAALEALDRAGATHIVNALDDGLDTLLGKSFEKGRDLSGGQWQNLALARSQMREQPLLLILDEPTASLDATTEHALFEQYLAATAAARASSGAITIIVSHRFSTVRHADLIVVIHKGRLVEQGTHDELITRKGTYQELYTLQAAAYLK